MDKRVIGALVLIVIVLAIFLLTRPTDSSEPKTSEPETTKTPEVKSEGETPPATTPEQETEPEPEGESADDLLNGLSSTRTRLGGLVEDANSVEEPEFEDDIITT